MNERKDKMPQHGPDGRVRGIAKVCEESVDGIHDGTGRQGNMAGSSNIDRTIPETGQVMGLQNTGLNRRGKQGPIPLTVVAPHSDIGASQH